MSITITTIRPINHAEFVELIHSQISGIKDIELLILKGQLLIEYALTQIIEKLRKAEPSEKYRLEFYTKLGIAEMLGVFDSPDNQQLLKAVKRINAIRNKMAHNLHYDRTLLQDLFKENQGILTLHPQATVADMTDDAFKLDWLITYVCAALMGALESIIIANNEYAALTTADLTKKINQKINDSLKPPGQSPSPI